jgi:hypothetical protein
MAASIFGLSDAQYRFKPQPECWSIAESVEHVAITEDILFGLVTGGLPNPGAAALPPAKDQKLAPAIVDRLRKFSAPDAVRSRGRFANPAESCARFHASRELSMIYARECSDDLRGRFTMHPLLGEIDCYRCFPSRLKQRQDFRVQIFNRLLTAGFRGDA